MLDVMLKEKRSGIMDYYESINAYSNYLYKYFSHQDYSKEIQILDKNITSALLSLISLNLVYKKEDVVENKENLEYDSKLYDFVLDNYLSVLDIRKDNKFKLGDYESELAATIFAKIRNKLAHGDYYIDNDKIYLNINGKFKDININLLSKVTESLSMCYMSCCKEKEYEKSFIIDKATESNLTFDLKNLESILKLMTIKSFKIKNKKDEIIPLEIKQAFILGIEQIKCYYSDKSKAKRLEQKLIDVFDEAGYFVSTSNKKIKNMDKIKTIAIDIKNSIQKKDDASMKYALCGVVNKMYDSNYNKDIIWRGSLNNQKILHKMICDKEYNINNIYSLEGTDEIWLFDELYISSILAKFNVLYSYPLDDIYKKNNNYKLEEERIDELDFGLLNLDDIKPNTLDLKIKQSDELVKKINGKLKQINKVLENINNSEISLNHVKDLNIKEKIKNNIEEKKKTLEESKKQYTELYTYYLSMIEDIEKNKKYFYNKKIIEGIRNALAHGNVIVINPLEESNPDDVILNFKDYDGKNLCMDLSLNLGQFKTLFSEENIDILRNFINNKTNVKRM